MRIGRSVNVVSAICTALLFVAAASPPDSPVADAAMEGDIEAVRALLKGGADVNAAQGDGMTALHWAAENGDVELTEILLYAGANVQAGTRIGDYTPLHLASRAGNAAVVRVLLEASSDPNATTTTGQATALHFAAMAGNAETIAALLEHGAEVNAGEAAWGQTPLMFAAAYNRVEAIEVLVERGADVSLTAKVVDLPAREEADDADEERRDQLLEALQAMQEEQRPREEQGEQQQRQQETPQQEARRQDAPQQEAQREQQQPRQEEPRQPQEPDEPPEAAPAEQQRQRPPRADEAQENEDDELSYAELVGGYGGLTALLLAARDGHVEAVLALLDAAADINQVSATDHTSPLLMATINGHFDLAAKLLEHGANPNLASDAGATPLYATLNTQWIPKSRHPQPTDYMQQQITYLELMEALLAAGADPNVRLKKKLWYTTYGRDMLGVDRMGATPFWRAAYATDVEAMKLLVSYGADPNIPTKKPPERRRRRNGEGREEADLSGLPPVPVGGPSVWPILAASGVGYGEGYAGNIHRHVPDGWLPAVKYLVEEHGADVNARDHNGYNAVHHAAARGDDRLILYLVEQGADVTAVSREGQTTADMSNGPVQRVPPFPETIELLESLGSKNNHNCVSC